MSMTDDFAVSGSTANLSSSDLLRELCGDDPEPSVVDPEFGDAPAESVYVDITDEVNIAAVMGDDNMEDYLASHKGEYFIWDIETFPDESRFPRPEVVQQARKEIDLTEVIKGTVEKISALLRGGELQEDQLEDLMQLEQSGKNRSTVTKAIQTAIENIGGEFEDWKKECSVNPWKGRIVALSWSFVSEEDVHTILAKNEEEERFLLATFWALHATGIRVGFNTREFDDKWIVARSMMLGVNPSAPLDLGRYSKDNVDIMITMFGSKQDAIACKVLAEMLGIVAPAAGVSGGDVFGMVDTQCWDLLREYSASDVVVEKELFKRVKRYVKV